MTTTPSVLLIGAQKAATTTLYELLRRHPDVFVPEHVKETNFLIDEGNWDRGIGWYQELWAPGRGHEHRVDVSPAYTAFPLFRHAPARAARLMPEAKLVYVIRHPVERMVSAWAQLVADGHEHRSLAPALLHEAHYTQVSSYAMQLDRWLAHFDREALLVLRAEDLRADPATALDRLLDHLELPTGWQPTELGETWNRSDDKVAAPRALRRAAAALTAAGATTLAARLGPRGRLGRRVRRPLRDDERRLDPALAEDLLGCFAADASRLRQIVGPGMDLWDLA